MKKIFLFVAVAFSALLSSCDMDKDPQGSLKLDQAVTDPVLARYYRNGFYNSFRGLTMGALDTYTEVQMDNFQALKDTYGNQLGNMFKGDFTSSTSDFAGVFSMFYGNISEINYFLPLNDKLIESEEYSEEDHINLIRFRGEAHFFRALNYYKLFSLFCQDYTPERANQPGLGVPLVTEFSPSVDRNTYPGRSTMAETLKFIFDDLQQAQDDIEAYVATLNTGSSAYTSLMGAGAVYVNPYVIDALRARIYLYMGEKELAYQYASGLANCGQFQLATGSAYARMFQYGEAGCNVQPGSGEAAVGEVIMMPAITNTEASSLGETDPYFWSYNTNNALYVPAYSTLTMYGAGDIRPSIFFEERDFYINGERITFNCFVKNDGNWQFTSASNIGCYTPKPFRISEMYLIMAECAPSVALQNEALRALRVARGISNYRNYPADRIIEQIRLERNRELIGEGFRLNDLRRYGQGFERDGYTATPQFGGDDYNTLYFVEGAMDLKYADDDYRFVWPIPSDELQVNPQIASQQNPGY